MKKVGKFLRVIAFAVIMGFTLTGCSGGGSGRNFTDVGRVEDWLARQSGWASPDDPISFRVNVNLQNMAAPESNWHRLLTSINTQVCMWLLTFPAVQCPVQRLMQTAA